MNGVSVGSATQASITVVLVDDHEIVRLGVQTILEQESSISVVGEAGNSHEAV
jgi:DNA-binding NarL/FixJ family response regulator